MSREMCLIVGLYKVLLKTSMEMSKPLGDIINIGVLGILTRLDGCVLPIIRVLKGNLKLTCYCRIYDQIYPYNTY